MSAREFDELLSAYLDGEVTAEERAAVEQRLEQSPALREKLDELSEVGDLVRSLPRARPPADLAERVLVTIAAKPLASSATDGSHAFWRRLRGWPLYSAGTLLAAGVMLAVILRPDVPAVGLRVATNDRIPDVLAPQGREMDSMAMAPASFSAGGMVDPIDRPAEALMFGREARTTSLATLVSNLNRKPQQGDVLRTLEDNAGQTQVLQYTVVDTDEIEGKLKTILINNRFDFVVTETPAPYSVAPAQPVANRLYFYVEGSPEQLDNTFKEIETQLTVTTVDEFGTLAQDAETSPAVLADELQQNLDSPSPAPEPAVAATPFAAPAADSQERDRNGQEGVRLPEISIGMRPPTPPAGVTDPAPAQDKKETSEKLNVRPGVAEAESVAENRPRPAPASASTSAKAGLDMRSEATSWADMPTEAAQPVSDGLNRGLARGVSAQLDATQATPIVDRYLGTRNQLSNSAQNGIRFYNGGGNQVGQRAVIRRSAGATEPVAPPVEPNFSEPQGSNLGLAGQQQARGRKQAEQQTGEADSAAAQASEKRQLEEQRIIGNSINGAVATGEPLSRAIIILQMAPAEPMPPASEALKAKND